MPLELAADIALTLLKLPLVLSIAATILFFAVGKRLNQYLREEFKLSWVIAAFATTFLVLVPIVFIVYLFPFWLGYSGSMLSGQPVPEFMQLTALDYAMAIVSTIVKNLITSLVFAVLLLFPIFIASFFEEKLKQRFKTPAIVNTFVSIFVTALILWTVIFFLLPWVYTGVLELIWWGI